MEKLGINPVLVITQIINFFILMFVLKRLLYKPVLKVLEDRKQKAQDIENAKKEIEEVKLEIDKTKESVIAESRKEADDIISTARSQGEKLKKRVEEEAHQKAQDIIKKGEESLAIKAKDLQEELSKEVGQVAVMVSENVLKDSLTDEQKTMLLNKSIKSFVESHE